MSTVAPDELSPTVCCPETYGAVTSPPARPSSRDLGRYRCTLPPLSVPHPACLRHVAIFTERAAPDSRRAPPPLPSLIPRRSVRTASGRRVPLRLPSRTKGLTFPVRTPADDRGPSVSRGVMRRSRARGHPSPAALVLASYPGSGGGAGPPFPPGRRRPLRVGLSRRARRDRAARLRPRRAACPEGHPRCPRETEAACQEARGPRTGGGPTPPSFRAGIRPSPGAG